MVAALLLLLLSPLLLILMIILAVANGGQPFFIQRRTGKKGKLFSIVKLRTMNNKKDAAGNLLPDNVRIHTIGRIVRKYSLDELPQLFNVLTGDMSMVGPRPLLPEYLPLYSEEQNKRHLVKPGITGWAQVNGRNALSWTEKFKLDTWYVQHVNFRTDLLILWRTFTNVIQPKGVNASESETMERFTGK